MKDNQLPVLCGQMGATAMLLTSIGLAIPRLAEDIDLTMTMRGNLVSAQFLGGTIALVAGGILCDTYGKLFVNKIFTLVAVFVSIFFGIVWNYPSVLIATFLLGGVTLILENAIISAGLNMGEKSMVANSLINTSFSVGAIIVPIMFLVCMQFGAWRPVYFVLAAIFFIGFIFSKGPLSKARGESLGSMLKKFGSFFIKPSHLFGPMLVFLYVAAEIGLWSFAPTFFESAGYGPLSGIASAFLIWVMIMIGRIINTVLIRKTTKMRILIPAGLIAILAYTCIMIFNGNAALFFMAVAGLVCAPFYPLLTSLSTEVSGDNSSSYVAFTMAMGCLGPALLGRVGGAAGEAFGSKFVILPPLVCFIIMTTAIIVFMLKKASDAKKLNNTIR